MIGDLLIALAAGFTIYLSVVMIRRINAVVLKESYVKIFRYELAACGFFILFALDVRFGFLGKAANKALLIGGWILRITVILVCAVLLFFLIKVTVGSFIRSEGIAGHEAADYEAGEAGMMHGEAAGYEEGGSRDIDDSDEDSEEKPEE